MTWGEGYFSIFLFIFQIRILRKCYNHMKEKVSKGTGLSPDDIDLLHQELEATFGIYKDADPEHLFGNFTGEDGMEHVKKARKILSSQNDKAKGCTDRKLGPGGDAPSTSNDDTNLEKKEEKKKGLFS